MVTRMVSLALCGCVLFCALASVARAAEPNYPPGFLVWNQLKQFDKVECEKKGLFGFKYKVRADDDNLASKAEFDALSGKVAWGADAAKPKFTKSETKKSPCTNQDVEYMNKDTFFNNWGTLAGMTWAAFGGVWPLYFPSQQDALNNGCFGCGPNGQVVIKVMLQDRYWIASGSGLDKLNCVWDSQDKKWIGTKDMK